MYENINREITQLEPDDVFLVINRIKQKFDFPIHFHPEYELNFILNGKGVRRVVGNSMEDIENVEMVLVGPNVEHGWETHNCKSKQIYEITIQFHDGLFDDKLLSLRIFKPIKELFNKSNHGILFSAKTALELMPRIVALSKIDSISDFTQLLTILQELANSKNQKLLSTYISKNNEYENSKKIKKVYEYIQKYYYRKISLSEISELVNMTPVSFNRFIKKRTGKTFVEYTNNIRLSYVSRWLINTDLSISEIGFKCGFNNIAHFNRFFKKTKGCTPREFRDEFVRIKQVS